MTTYDTDGSNATARDGPDRDVSPCYQAYLERNDYRPDSCTIYSTVTGASARTQWLKARGDAFVSREEMR